MSRFLRWPLVVLCCLLLAAHFLRDGDVALVVVILAAPLLLLIRRRWSRVALQTLLLVAAAIWMVTAVGLVQARMAEGRPWLRLLAILGPVALLNVATLFLLSWTSRDAASHRPVGSGGAEGGI